MFPFCFLSLRLFLLIHGLRKVPTNFCQAAHCHTPLATSPREGSDTLSLTAWARLGPTFSTNLGLRDRELARHARKPSSAVNNRSVLYSGPVVYGHRNAAPVLGQLGLQTPHRSRLRIGFMAHRHLIIFPALPDGSPGCCSCSPLTMKGSPLGTV